MIKLSAPSPAFYALGSEYLRDISLKRSSPFLVSLILFTTFLHDVYLFIRYTVLLQRTLDRF